MWRRHRVLCFYLLALALSWYPWVLALLRGATTGPNPLGPLVAGLIVTALADGWRAVGTYLGRIVRFRVAPRWYAAALLLPLAVTLFATGAAWILGAPRPDAASWPSWRELPDRFLFILLFVALGEEPGWRGFALEHLQRRRSALAATLILAPMWALWHLPLFGSEFAPPLIAPFLVSLLSATAITTWLYNRTGGSVLPAMLFHATVNTVGSGFLFRTFGGTDLARLWWIYALAWLAASATIVGTVGIERWRRQRPETRAAAST